MAGKFLLSAVHWHSLTVAKGWWCQAFHGSCVGQRHKFQESDASFQDQVTPLLRGKSQLHGLRFADWDSDGDMDVLVAENESLSLWFYERLPGPGDSFKKHKLMPFWQSSFEVADWDGDGRPDLLVCSRTNSSSAGANVRFLKRDLFLAGGGADFIMLRKAPIILSTNETVCDMQAVDFDEDGDLDLALSDLYASSGRGGRWPTRRLRKYFERVSDEVSALEERTGEDNPLEAFADPVQQIADLDGDGRLDVLVQVGIQTWRCFRRTAAGTFVEQLEHPLMETPSLDGYPLHPWDLYVADWNSDGFPDVLFVIDSGSEMFGWEVLAYYQHVVDRDLRHNSHFKTYENIPLPSRANFIVEDWNEDGFDDVMVFSREELGRNESLTFRRYEYQPRDMKEVDAFSIPFKHSHTRDSDGLDNFALIDWDRDGALDLLFTSEDDGKVHFYRNLSDEPAEHPFKKIRLRKDSDQAWILALPMVVDWDNDGDFDLFLGPSDGRYFEQLADGSLHEWPLEQSPLMSAMKLLAPSYGSYRRRRGPKWQFLDCDADGDFDLIQVPHSKAPAQACEHDAGTHELRCGPDFLCLGTNVSRYQEGADHGRSFFSVLDGQLKLFVYKQDACEQGGRIELWTPGFCMPMNDPCHGKGYCLPGELRCRCIPGHEGADCSRCQPLFYTMHRKELQVQNCRPCPGDEFAGKVCYGRGTCFDDAMAKRLQQDSTAAWMAIGNGSCSCYEAFFYGTDQDGRSTCMEGHCPAGTEEVDGNCSFCPGGSSSDVGGVCKECPAGRVSKTSGSSTCEPCPAGTYESERQFCNACSPGKISREGSAACSPCDAGHFAKEAMVCELCPGGTFSPAGQSACQNCLPGTFSERGSINCPKCPAGTISQVAASACQACPVGTFEINKQVCSPCPPGTVSAVGTAGRDCSPCRAGRFAVAGALTCEQCPNGTISAARSSQCRGCPAGKFSQAGLICERCPFGTVSDAVAGFCQPCDAGRFAKRALTCEPCPGGTFADPNSSSCQKCDLGHVSLPNSPKCRSCNDLLVRAVPDATGQTCQVKTLDIVLA